MCCGPLQSPQLWRLLRTGWPHKPGVLPAHQPPPEGGALPEPTEQRPPQRHVMTLCRSVYGQRAKSLKRVAAPHADHFTQLFPAHPVTMKSHSSSYLWMETSSWSGIWRVFIIQISQSDNHFSNNNRVTHLNIVLSNT